MIMKSQKLILSLSLFLITTFGYSQALVDFPCGGLTAGFQWTIGAPCVNITTAGMVPDVNPGSCGSGANDDAWGWFAGDGNLITVTLSGLNSNGILHVYELTAPPCAGITNVYCSNNALLTNETVTFPSTLGNTYLIRIQRQGSNNTLTGCLRVTSTPPVPGCTDPIASNYNPLATVDNGTCTYAGVDYIHPIVGIAGEFVGSCLVNNCGPFVYADNGGLGSNYGLNIGSIGAPHYGGTYRVFCPSIAGNCMRATFTSFNTEATYDYMQVKNGPTQNSPNFALLHTGTVYGAGVTGMSGNLAGSMPAVFNATGPSGCLTFRFFSDNTVTAPGWSATLQCVPCAGGPNGTDPSDCMNLIPLCSGASVPGDATGPGIVAEGCSGSACPAGGENHSMWYQIQAQTTGTINVTITPTDPTDDYDFAIYGPNATCGALGAPLRCTDAATTGTTGTGGDTDATEPASGNGQLATINAIAGQTFIIVVDEWSPNPTASGFNLGFGGTANLDCAILPVELSEFSATYVADENVVDLFWSTASERNNDRFEVERSTDGVHYEIINTVKGAGTTSSETQYYTIDTDPSIGMNYYRLNQWDTDGNGKHSEVRAVNILDDVYDLLSFFPNPTSGKTEVIFNSYLKEEVYLEVTTFDGKTVVNMPLNAEKGGNRFDLDLTHLNGHLFIVTITTSEKVYSGKLMKN